MIFFIIYLLGILAFLLIDKKNQAHLVVVLLWPVVVILATKNYLVEVKKIYKMKKVLKSLKKLRRQMERDALILREMNISEEEILVLMEKKYGFSMGKHFNGNPTIIVRGDDLGRNE
jgi:hypothetical protein